MRSVLGFTDSLPQITSNFRVCNFCVLRPCKDTRGHTWGGISQQQRRRKTENKPQNRLGSGTIWLFVDPRISIDWGFPFDGTSKKAFRRLG